MSFIVKIQWNIMSFIVKIQWNNDIKFVKIPRIRNLFDYISLAF